MLILEGAQAGLSGLTILKKRENHCAAFDNFDAERVAAYGETKIKGLMKDAGIIRNRLEIDAAIRNARAVLKIREIYGSLDSILWRYVDGVQKVNHWSTLADLPAQTVLSQRMSQDLKSLGCNFVGPTICYSFMQAIGMVNDHTIDCFRYEELKRNG